MHPRISQNVTGVSTARYQVIENGSIAITDEIHNQPNVCLTFV